MTKTIKTVTKVVSVIVAIVVAVLAIVAVIERVVKKFTKVNVAAKPIVPNSELEQVGVNRYDWGYEKLYIKKGVTELYDNNNQLMFMYHDNNGYKIENGILIDTNEYPFDIPTKFDLTKGAILRKEDIKDIVEFEGEDIYLCYIVTKDNAIFNCSNGKKESLSSIIENRRFLEESHIKETEWDSCIEDFNIAQFIEYRALN